MKMQTKMTNIQDGDFLYFPFYYIWFMDKNVQVWQLNNNAKSYICPNMNTLIYANVISFSRYVNIHNAIT